MADKKISALGAMTAPAIADFLHVIDDNSGTYTNQKITLATLLTLAPGYLGFGTIQSATGSTGTVVCDITSAVTQITSTGAYALSLANGTTAGQLKILIMVADGGSVTCAPATRNGWASCLFADDGDCAVLFYSDSTIGWSILSTGGLSASADTSGPVIT